MRDSSHLRGSERAHQPDQREVSSWRFCRAYTESRPPAFPVSLAFLQTRVFHQARGFQRPQGFYRPPDFQQTQGFLNPLDFQQTQGFLNPPNFLWPQGFLNPEGFSIRKDSQSGRILNPEGFSIRKDFSIRKNLYIFSVFYFSAFLIEYAPIFYWRNYFWPLGLRLIL
jgi:hypothetical protein